MLEPLRPPTAWETEQKEYAELLTSLEVKNISVILQLRERAFPNGVGLLTELA
jgi:hypothetical protein